MSRKSTTERITVTLPGGVLEEVDRHDTNRSRFVLEAVRQELARRKRLDLLRSLAMPHAETEEIAEAGLDEWADRLPVEDAEGLVDGPSGTPIRWVPGEGWRESPE